MRTFSELIIEKNDNSQLDIGIKIESEHNDIYEILEEYLKSKNIQMPLTKHEFYKKIAEAHLRELPDYYTRLQKMESN